MIDPWTKLKTPPNYLRGLPPLNHRALCFSAFLAHRVRLQQQRLLWHSPMVVPTTFLIQETRLGVPWVEEGLWDPFSHQQYFLQMRS